MNQGFAKVFSPDTTSLLPRDLMDTSKTSWMKVFNTMRFKLFITQLIIPLLRLATKLLERTRRLWAFASLRSELPDLDASVVVLGRPELHGTRKVTMGRGLFLFRDLYLETRGEGLVELGDEVVISRGVHIVAFSSVKIGAGTMIGEYTSIRDANHRFGPGLSPRHSGYHARPVNIGRNVWIGRGVSILPGVNIGDGAVIGANAVVTHDVAPQAVVGGVPARELHREVLA